MPKRDEIKIRRSTNLYDLLDDGIANNSDISELTRLQSDTGESDAQATPSFRQTGHIRADSTPARGVRSWGGAFLGTCLAIAGTIVALHPEEMIVWHTRIRYLPTVAEHVTANEARMYSLVVASAGLLIVLVSLMRMRNSAIGRT